MLCVVSPVQGVLFTTQLRCPLALPAFIGFVPVPSEFPMTPGDRACARPPLSVWRLPCLVTARFQELTVPRYPPLALPPQVLGSRRGGAARAGPPTLLSPSGFVSGANRLHPDGLTCFHGDGLPQYHSYWPPTVSPEGWAIRWPVPSR